MKIEENYRIDYKYNEKEDISIILYDKYKKLKENEFRFGHTLFGPHVDDFNFYINNKKHKKTIHLKVKKNIYYLILNMPNYSIIKIYMMIIL